MLRVVSELSQALVTTSFIFFSLTCQILLHAVSGCAPSDMIALASFSNNLDSHITSPWPGAENYSADDCCRWTGVRCRRFRSPYQQQLQLRVVSLDLAGLGLSGSVPSTLDRLNRLRVLNLSRNLFHGAVPPELLRMPRLRVLDLSQNNLSGDLSVSAAGPASSSSRTSGIRHLDASFNGLTSLRDDVFQALPLLRNFSAESNQLTGVLPPSLSSCSELQYLNMANNSLHGTLGSTNFSRLTRLRALHLGWNRFHGRLPASLSRCRELTVVNLRRNNLSGPVPSSFRRLRALTFFDVGDNSIAGVARALRALQECRRLAVLILTTNFQGEEMPGAAAGIHGFPSLRLLGIANCALRGAVPPWLRASARLNVLDLSWNRLTGRIPPWLGGFGAVYRIDLSSIALTGEIPRSLTRLRSLAGGANASARVQLCMSDYGVRLYNWHVERGQLWYDSYIPPSLDLSRNRLAGVIPPELGDLVALKLLNLSWNALSGPIPATLASLRDLQTLDLSYNELAGEIPASLTALTFLSCFDVSHNRLRGFIPNTSQFSTFPCSSFAGNPDLHGVYCGGSTAAVHVQMPGHDGPNFLTAIVDNFGMPFMLGMISGLCATVLFMWSIDPIIMRKD